MKPLGFLENQITLRYRAQLAALIGRGVDRIEAKDLKDVKEALNHIKKTYGAPAVKTAKTMLIAVNGESILHLKMYKTSLKAGDELSFLPICGGG
jgi:molybdopterin synthase sulfur carrier subunit